MQARRERELSIADSPATLRSELLDFQIRKGPQVSCVHVRNGPEFESIAITAETSNSLSI
jgi:hypothetical protein